MSPWPPADATTFLLSSEFAARMRVLTRRLVHLFPTQASAAEDAVYDALADLLLSQKRGWGPKELADWLRTFPAQPRFEAYLFRTAYRRALKGLRKYRKLPEQPLVGDLPDSTPIPEDLEESNSLLERVALAVPGDEREVLHLLVEGASAGEIAEYLGVTEQTVYRIKRDLRQILWTMSQGRKG